MLVDSSTRTEKAPKQLLSQFATKPCWSQPARVPALHVRVSKALMPVSVATYAVWVRLLTSRSPGPSGTAKLGAGVAGQPERCAALQAAGARPETVLSMKLAM